MRVIRRTIILIAAALLGSTGAAADLVLPPLGLLVPAYSYPLPGNPFWPALEEAATRVPLIAILNPYNGPDTTANPEYVEVVNRVRQAGGKVIGYVHSDHGARVITEVLDEIDRYPTFYAIDGIFVDEMSSDPDRIAYYSEIYDHVKTLAPEYVVVGNPGTHTDPLYLQVPVADILVTYESSAGYPAYEPSPWVPGFPPSSFCHLVYGVASADTMSHYLQLALSRHVGWVYVTDDVNPPNPWDDLASYWTAEVAAVEATRNAVGEIPRDGEAVLRIAPSPARIADGARITLACSGAAADVEVLDAQGRRVRRLATRSTVEGLRSTHWDGRDPVGHRVNPGVYFLVARCGTATVRARLVLVE